MPDRQLRMCGCAQWTSLKTLSAQTGDGEPARSRRDNSECPRLACTAESATAYPDE